MPLYIDNIRKQQGRTAALKYAFVSRLSRTGLGEHLIAWWRGQRLRKYDAFILSYPKCGRTWVRLILSKIFVAKYELPEPSDPFDLETLPDLSDRPVPRIRVTHDDDAYLKAPEEQRTTRREYRHAKVILLVRDPRDVLVSNYFQARRRHGYFKGTLSEFIRSPLGAPSLLRYLQIWHDNCNVPAGFLLLRYEDLVEDTVREMKRLLQFLDVDAPETIVSHAVEACGFEKMQNMERDGIMASGRLTPGDENDPESYKVRRGKVGGYKEYMSDQDITYLETLMARELPENYGYSPEHVQRPR